MVPSIPLARPLTVRLAGLVLLVLVSGSGLRAAPNDKLPRLTREHTARQQQFAADMQSLASFCEANGFADDAERIRQLAVPMDRQTLDVDNLPETRQAE